MRLAELASSAAPALVALSFGGGCCQVWLWRIKLHSPLSPKPVRAQAATKAPLLVPRRSAARRCWHILHLFSSDVIDALARVESRMTLAA